MTDRLINVTVNVATGQVEEIELTADEIVEREALAASHNEIVEAEAAHAALVASARQKLVDGVALTEEEAALLIK